MYITCEPRACPTVITRIEACLDDIRNWMVINKLALNEGKTELVLFSSRNGGTGSRSVALGVRVGEATISPSSVVRDLGVMLDSFGLMDEHIRHVCGGGVSFTLEIR